MDSLFLKERKIGKRSMCMAVVCDGVGSLEDGAFAATMAVRMLGNWFDQVNDFKRLGLKLRDQVVEMNRVIYRIAQAKGKKTATTISVLLLDGEHYYIVHLGDSRIYSFIENALVQLTQDQKSQSGKLIMCLGYTENIVPFYGEGLINTQKFLLCTDGLYKRASSEYIRKSVQSANHKNLKNTLEELAHYVIGQGERDNVTIAIILNQ